MICFPNAKINLGLNIVSKRADGYHNLETIFYPINICDALEIIENKEGKDRLFTRGIDVNSSAEDNLVMKALKLLRTEYNFPFLDVHLLKKTPFGAGIGGGSSDAAHLLKLVNDKYELELNKSALANLAVKLGADCPFFVYNRAYYASGIGEQLEEVELDLSNYKIALVKPNVFVSTKDAFSLVKPKQAELNLKEVIKRPLWEWKDLMVNDFEASVFAKHQGIKEIKEKFYTEGAIYASMTGSGSSVFAIFEKNYTNKLEFDNAEYYFDI